MATRLYVNNYTSTLASAITNSATTIVVTNATGLPTITGSDYYYLTLAAGAVIEIVKVTARTGTTLTVTRAQESTTGVAWAAGDIISLRETAESFSSITTGATSSTDNAVARFDGTTGKVIQNSGVIIDDSNNVTGIVSATATSKVTIGGNATLAGYIELLEDTDNGSNKITLTPPQSIASDKTVTLQDVTGTVYVSSGTDVTVADGGTGVSSVTAYAPIVGGTTSTGALQSTASGSTGQILQSAGNASVPTWSTPTYPSASGTALKYLRSDGTNIIYSTATISDTPSTSGKILISDGTNWITSTSLFPNTVGTSGKFLISDGTVNGYSTSTIPTSAGSTALKHLKSDGTNYVLTTATFSDTPSTSGKILISDGTNWITSTAIFPNTVGTSGKVLISDGTVNGYSTSTFPTSAGATALKHLRSDGTNYVLTTATISDTPSTAGKLLVSDGTNWITSTPTFPNASATSGKIIKSDGTNWIASTETYAAPGTSGNILTSDGTNWTSSSSGGKDAYTTTATAAGTTTLTVSSTYQQYFTGSTTQTVVMPVTSTLALGYSWRIVNNSTGTVTVQSSGANNIIALVANTEAIVTCILTSGTTAASWDYQIQTTNLVGTGTGQVVRATSPTLVTPLLGTPTSGTLTNCTGLPVAGGGTGLAATTAYAVLCGGTTSTAALQSIASVGSAGQWLLSAGASALPAFGVPNSCFIGSTADQNVSTSTFTAITCDYEQFDNGNLHSTVTNNTRITIGQTGVYMIYANVYYSSNNTGTRQVYVKKNGTTFLPGFNIISASVSSGDDAVSITFVQQLTAADYIELFAWQDSGSTLSAKSDSLGGYTTGLAVFRVG